jgi:thymidylate synthase
MTPTHPEDQYLSLVQSVLERGSREEGRNGTTISLFGASMRFSLKDGEIPLLTTKRVAWKTCFKELMWFISGNTDNRLLQEQKVNIWNGNSTREYLDSRGLTHLREGDIGPGYGFQWRHYNATYTDCARDYTGQGIDQLQSIINQLKTTEGRTSRRLILTAWNPNQLDEMALPPCHIFAQFYVRDNTYLSCSMYQRSGDLGLGVPFNIASYSFMTHLLAKHCNLIAEEFIYFLGNAHIYEGHIEPLKQQLQRRPKPFPKIDVINQYEDIEKYTTNDILWKTPYEYHEEIQMEMVV